MQCGHNDGQVVRLGAHLKHLWHVFRENVADEMVVFILPCGVEQRIKWRVARVAHELYCGVASECDGLYNVLLLRMPIVAMLSAAWRCAVHEER